MVGGGRSQNSRGELETRGALLRRRGEQPAAVAAAVASAAVATAVATPAIAAAAAVTTTLVPTV